MSYWVRKIKLDIRLYLLADLQRQDIDQEFIKLDADIAPGISQWSDMPKGPRSNSSPVEREVLARERIAAELIYRLKKIQEHEYRMNIALEQLYPHERELIELLYFSVSFNYGYIMKRLGISDLESEKKRVLSRLYDLFYETDQRVS